MTTCPECNVQLDNIDMEAHAHYHWPNDWDETDARYQEAMRRKRALVEAERQRRRQAVLQEATQ